MEILNNQNSSIIDNHHNGTVKDFLENHITETSLLSFVSAYFNIYAYNLIKDKLDNAKEMRFLFGEPSFINNFDENKHTPRSFIYNKEIESISMIDNLKMSSIAKECKKWFEKENVQVRSLIEP
ncbi:MAG: ATP-dependent helicase, partial [Candidatus Kapabacteria bacterium]|nr:ATP-dependent helicase [Candidatus Kapabacteria bacterium]